MVIQWVNGCREREKVTERFAPCTAGVVHEYVHFLFSLGHKCADSIRRDSVMKREREKGKVMSYFMQSASCDRSPVT
jgi:hypothetical protein